VKQLRFTIIIGSLIPLICYVLWDAVVQGNVARQHLILDAKSGHAVSALTTSLSVIAHSQFINIFAHFFTSICVMTAFLGVGIAVTDFLADGFKVRKKRIGSLFVLLTTLLPPFFIVFFYPPIFLKAINFAGVSCVILLVLLPSLMVWSGRYHKKIATIQLVPGGRMLVLFWMVISIFLLILSAI